MSGTAAYGVRISVEDGATPTFDATSERWDFNSFDVGHSQEILERAGIRGTRLAHNVDTRLGQVELRPTGTINPSPKFLGLWLMRALGGGTETAPAVADALPEFGILVDHSEDVYKVLGCKVDQFTLQINAGQLVECTVGMLARTIDDDQVFAGAALGTTLAYEPFQAADVTLNLDSTGQNYTGVILTGTLSIDNQLTARNAWGSLNAENIFPGNRRQIRFSGTAAFTTAAAALRDAWTPAGASGGVAGTLTLANSTVSTVFTFSRFQRRNEYTRIEGSEVIMPITAEVRTTAAGTAELTVANDITP